MKFPNEVLEKARHTVTVTRCRTFSGNQVTLIWSERGKTVLNIPTATSLRHEQLCALAQAAIQTSYSDVLKILTMAFQSIANYPSATDEELILWLYGNDYPHP